MSAYWVVHVDVHDTASYARYAELASGVVAAHGGEYLVRAGRYRQTEGTERARQVIVRFPDYETALACYESPGYQEALAHALPASTRDFVIVEGLG